MTLTQDAVNPVTDFVNSVKELSTFRAEYVEAMSFMSINIPAMADLAKAMKKADVEAGLLEQAGRFTEVSTKRAYMDELCVVRLWTCVEVLAFDSVFHRLRHNDWWRTSELIQGIKGDVVAFSMMNPEQQIGYIRDEVRRTKVPKAKGDLAGIRKFLELFDLAPLLTPSAERCVLHLAAARNVIVHRQSRIDHAFAERCPWVRAEIGSRLSISNELFVAFCLGAWAFGAGLAERAHQIGFEWVDVQDGKEVEELRVSMCAKADRAYDGAIGDGAKPTSSDSLVGKSLLEHQPESRSEL